MPELNNVFHKQLCKNYGKAFQTPQNSDSNDYDESDDDIQDTLEGMAVIQSSRGEGMGQQADCTINNSSISDSMHLYFVKDHSEL